MIQIRIFGRDLWQYGENISEISWNNEKFVMGGNKSKQVTSSGKPGTY